MQPKSGQETEVDQPAEDAATQQKSSAGKAGKPAEVLEELKELLLAYCRQEAVEPLKRLLAWLGWGMLGALFLTAGMILLALAALRALQTQTGEHLTGSLSWTPYAIVLTAVTLILIFAVKAARARRRSGSEAANK